MKPSLLLLIKFSNSFRFRINHHCSSHLLLLRRFWNEKVTKFIENIRSWDHFQIVFTFLQILCAVGVAPYRFDRNGNILCPQEGWKWLLWRLVYGVVLPLRLLLSLFTPLFTSMEFKPVGNHVGVDDLNIIVYFVLLEITMLYAPVVYCFINDSALIARLFRLYFQLDSEPLRKLGSVMHAKLV